MKTLSTILLIAGTVLALNVLVQFHIINQYNSNLDKEMARAEGWR